MRACERGICHISAVYKLSLCTTVAFWSKRPESLINLNTQSNTFFIFIQAQVPCMYVGVVLIIGHAF